MLTRTLLFFAGASLVLALSAELSAQANTKVITSPAPGSPNQFGRLIEQWGPHIIIADETEVSIYNVQDDAFETNSLLFPVLGVVDSVDDVALQFPYAAVAYTKGGIAGAVGFEFIGSQWVYKGTLGAVSFVPGGIQLCFPSAQFVPVVTAAVATPTGECVIRNYDFELNATTGLALVPGQGFPKQIAAGSKWWGGLAVAVTLEEGSKRRVAVLSYDPGGFNLEYEALAGGAPSADGTFGDALALSDSQLWIGAPGIGVSPNPTGTVWRYALYGSVLVYLEETLYGGIVGEGFGRAISALPNTALISQGGTGNLFSGSTDVGFVHAYRQDGFDWEKSGEVYFTPNPSAAAPGEFGRTVSISATSTTRAAFGETGGPLVNGRVIVREIPLESIFDLKDGSPLSPSGGLTPKVKLFGNTIGDAPFAVQVYDAAPLTTAFLVLGLSKVSAPFKGGYLSPNPDLVLPIPTDADGEIMLVTTWPDVGALSFDLFGQVWVQDPAGPVGFTASLGFIARQD